jgi:hypothetical protein
MVAPRARRGTRPGQAPLPPVEHTVFAVLHRIASFLY